jgi:hypothetical protein
MAKTRITVVRIKGNVQWQTHRAKGGNWVGICNPLKLTVQSDTWASLMEDIAFTLDAVLKDLLSTNEFHKFMRDQGWRLIGSIPSRKENMRFDLPFYPVALHGSQRNFCQ